MATDADLLSATPRDPDPVDGRPPLVEGELGLHDVTELVARPLEWKAPLGWYLFLACALGMVAVGVVSSVELVREGTGVSGINHPVTWGWAVVNLVFWLGIGIAGSLISALLLLLRQRWRSSISRLAGTMGLLAVICALLFPAIHVGRVWLLPWLLPFPNQMELWPNFRSPLIWDLFAIIAFGAVSALFWFLGLLPDLASLRDRSKTRLRRLVYGLLALGWRSSARHWLHHQRARLVLAALTTALALALSAIVAWDFASTLIPGWHGTIFPLTFAAGAIFSGLAMLVILLVITRELFGLKQLVTLRHLENTIKLVLTMSLVVGYAYFVEHFVAWYSVDPYQGFSYHYRGLGSYALAYYGMLACNVMLPQIFWSRRLRNDLVWMLLVSIFISLGVWLERFVVIVTSMQSDFLPSSWGSYSPTRIDLAIFVGSFGVFFTLFSLFVRFLPMVAIAEVKRVLPEPGGHGHDVAPDQAPDETPATTDEQPAGSEA